jgi:hypothetical protein
LGAVCVSRITDTSFHVREMGHGYVME